MSKLRLVFMGKTGSGKSSTGNTIIGRDVFESMTSAASVTNECQKHGTTINGQKVAVVDTPGFFDTNVPQEKVIQEISRCISMTTPGPHAFLFVIGIGRFTEEEINTVELFVKQFGENVKDYIIVVFSRADDLGGTSIDSYLATAPRRLQDFIKSCDNRYVTIDNKNKPQGQVLRLFDLINKTVENNGKKHYTNAMYEENLEMLRIHEEELKKELAEKEARKIKQTEEICMNKMSAEIKKYQEQILEQQRDIENLENEIYRLKATSEDQRWVNDLKIEVEELNNSMKKNQSEHDEIVRTLKLDIEKKSQQEIQILRESFNIEREELRERVTEDITKKMTKKITDNDEKHMRNQSEMLKTFKQKLQMQEKKHQEEMKKIKDDKYCVIL